MVQLRPYVIRQGDYVAKLAHRHGFDAAEVWQLPKNETLRRKRGSPDILYPGDILYIPERDQPGQSVRAGGEQRYRVPDDDEDVAAAIAAFQHDRGMIITSVADGALLAALKKAHRS